MKTKAKKGRKATEPMNVVPPLTGTWRWSSTERAKVIDAKLIRTPGLPGLLVAEVETSHGTRLELSNVGNGHGFTISKVAAASLRDLLDEWVKKPDQDVVTFTRWQSGAGELTLAK